MRKAGVLLPIASLPSSYGIGDLGSYAIDFIDLLEKMGMKIWQILPINPLGYGNSPYQPFSSYAGEPSLISLDGLVDMGLLKGAACFNKFETVIDYTACMEFKLPFFKRAYERFLVSDVLLKEYEFFVLNNSWVENYGVFMAFKVKNDLKCWVEWPKDQRDWILDKQYDLTKLEYEIGFHRFLQFVFYRQWSKLKGYANDHGIEIMGDIPIYVGIDSLDVWENQSVFLLDDDKKPTHIAGVPPDYFSKTGQRWGNPLYDWEYLKSTGFKFWIERLSGNSKLFDIIRIDHFRAFDTYWKIPASCDTAIDGVWALAPGYELFDKIYECLPDIEIVAEDLGDMRPEVFELRDHYNLKGMKIVQFTFDPNESNNDFEDRKNMMIYTGTHDNQTMYGWFVSQNQEEKIEIVSYLDSLGYSGNVCDCFLNYTFDSIADYAIVPVQDILGLDDVGRINEPGTLGSPNWEWKLASFDVLELRVLFIQSLLRKSKR